MTENSKNKLAKLCGYSEERYTDKVKEGVRKKYPYPEDEIAILRKAVAYLFELISKLHEGEIDNSEFAEYNSFVEQLKAEAKEVLKQTEAEYEAICAEEAKEG